MKSYRKLTEKDPGFVDGKDRFIPNGEVGMRAVTSPEILNDRIAGFQKIKDAHNARFDAAIKDLQAEKQQLETDLKAQGLL